MMEQRRVQSFTSSPYQYVVDYPGSQDLSRVDSHEPIPMNHGNGSYDERMSFHHLARETSSTRSLSAPIDAFDSWLLEGPACGSPMSTSSSISHNESVPTPPYAGVPMCDTVESPAFHYVHSPVNHKAWTGEPEHVWRPSYPDLPTWGSQQFSLPYHGGPVCEQLSLQPVQGYTPHPGPPVAPAYIPYQAPVPYSAARVVNPEPLKKEVASDAGLNDKESDSESEESESDDDASLHGSSYSSSRRSGANANVMKLGKWGENPASYPLHHTLDVRHWQCPLDDKEHPEVPCPKRFQRPEHLRRHVRTVHGNDRCHFCKVCVKTFSRGDNLRDHYWTHVNRGGRSGKNHKMSIPELKAILGPKERPLIRRLKMKLNLLKERNIRAKL